MRKELQKYFNPSNLELAFRRVQVWPERIVKDKVGIRAFALNLDKNCMHLSNLLKEGKYQPRRGFKFYVPKSSRTLRTKTLLYIEDAVVYQAIANVIAQESYPKLLGHEDFVFGSVLNKEVVKGVALLDEEEPNFFFFKFWKDLFERFKNSVIHSIKEEKMRFKFETDITGFFDCIPHYNLLDTLSQEFKVPDEVLDLLGECLNIWSGTKDGMTPGVGIPQGPLPSHLLANLILYKLDSELVSKHYTYYRYMDDIKIYAHEEDELQEVLLIIDKYLKTNGLSINSKKTNIEEILDPNVDETVKKFERFFIRALSYSGEDEESETSLKNDIPKSIERDVKHLEQQDYTDDGSFDESEILTDRQEIIEFHQSNIEEVKETLPKYFEDPNKPLDELVLKDGIEDIDFIGMSAQYGNSLRGLAGVEQEYEPDQMLLKYWLFAIKKFFWRANILNYTLSYYGNDDSLKKSLEKLYDHFELFEWVRYYLVTNLSMNFDFTDRELRQRYSKHYLSEERSDLVRIALYRLILKKAESKQLKSSIQKQLLQESLYVRLLVADFIRYTQSEEMSNQEIFKLIGI